MKSCALPLINNKIPSLNGWRAIAVLMVIYSHCIYAKNFPTLLLNSNLYFVEIGNLGVRIFFILSGFLITHLLLNEAENNNHISLNQFYWRRCLRILPVYACYVGVTRSMQAIGFIHDTPSSWLGALTFTRNFFGHGNSVTAHFWSLAVEEQFYLIWPCLFVGLLLWRRVQLAFVLLLIPIVLCPMERMLGFDGRTENIIIDRIFGNWSILAYADSLAIGCSGAFLARHMKYRLTDFQAFLITSICIIVIIWGIRYVGHSGIGPGWVFVPMFQAISIMATIWISIHNSGGLGYKLLNWSLFNWLGTLSYSIYIWHMLFLSGMINNSKTGDLFIYKWYIWWLFALSAATISYYWVERPILRFKGKLH